MKISMFGKGFGSVFDISEKTINKIFYNDDDYFKPTKSDSKNYQPEPIKPKQIGSTISKEAAPNQDISEVFATLKFFNSLSSEKDIFFKQATYIRNLEDNFDKPYVSYITSKEKKYSELPFSDFRAYITWRTQFRHQQYNVTKTGFLLFYLNELVLHIHDLTNDEILLEIIQLLHTYESAARPIDEIDIIVSFIRDFIILNPVSFSYDEIQAKIGSTTKLFSTNLFDTDKNRYDKNLLALSLQSSYKFLESPLLTSKYGYLYGSCIDYTFKRIEEYLAQYDIDLYVTLFSHSLRKKCHEWKPYYGSIFFSFDKDLKLDVTTPDGIRYVKVTRHQILYYNCEISSNILREAFGFAIKLMESRLRENLGFTPKLKANPQKVTIESPRLTIKELKRFRSVAPLFVKTDMINLILNAVDSFYELSKLPKGVASKAYKLRQEKIAAGEIDDTPINREIDSSKFEDIRQGSEYLRQVLVVEEETEEEHSEPETIDNYKEETQIENDISTECTDETDEYHQLIKSLSETESQCIKIICDGQDILDKLNNLGNENNLTAQTIMDSINEKALDLIGDNLIDSADEPYIYEDYLTEIQNIIKED